MLVRPTQRLTCALFSLTFFSLVACAGGIRRPGRVSTERENIRNLPETIQGGNTPVPGQQRYRQVVDAPEIATAYAEAKRKLGTSESYQGYRSLQAYADANPNGQFVDDALILLAARAVGESQFSLAATHAGKVLALDPPSRQRARAVLLKARAEFLAGSREESLRTLSHVQAEEISAGDRYDFFKFWGEAAEFEGRSLESTLAYLRAINATPVMAAQEELKRKVDSFVETKLSETELRFLQREYALPAYPSSRVHLRLAALAIASGSKLTADQYLALVMRSNPPGSPMFNEAREMKERAENLGMARLTRIGLLLPMSGAGAYGATVKEGLDLAFAETSGAQIEVVAADSGRSVDSAMAAFERLVMEERVMAVIGPVSGDQAAATAVKAREWGVPYITLSARDGLLESNPFLFRMAATPQKQVRALVKHTAERFNAKRFAIIFPEDTFGEAFAKAYFDAVAGVGGTVTAAESYQPNQADFRSEIQNMVGNNFTEWRRSERAELIKTQESKLGRKLSPKESNEFQLPPIMDFDVIFLPDSSKAIGQIVPYLRYADVTGPKLVGPSTWSSQDLLRRAGQYLDNSMFVDSFSPDRSGTESFLKSYRDKYQKMPGALSAFGYDIGLSLARAYRGAELPKSREDLRLRLTSLGSMRGATGELVWNESRDVLKELQLFVIRGGKFLYQSGVVTE
ncbi:MAG TPA: penicillin-binding protein activator [Bdellovibrionota bacterium]|nr:penicillin-binding protein activator [Bdellovibrionota bacterium]